MAKKVDARPPAEDPHRRAFRVALLCVLVALALTTEERTFGTVADEQQVLYTGVSMAEFGEIGVARGALFTVQRPEGDAVSPYGIGLSILNALPALVAAPFERALGAGASSSLFVLVSILLVALAAAGAGLLARELGAPPEGVVLALAGTALGSPLWAYAGANYSEPLQAAALALAVLLASRRRAAAAGLLAGAAVLAKGTNVVLFPLTALPLLLDGAEPWSAPSRRKRLLAFAAGAAVSLGVWLGFEIVRFGRPLASYGGTGFTHPFLDGFWRLLIGPNKGILFYFPLVVLSLLGLSRLARRREVRGTFLALLGIPAALLLLASAWFAWDGVVGWGPRLLVPGIPLLAAAAGASASTRAARIAGRCLVAAGILLNALGVFQSEAATSAYLAAAPPLVVSEKEAARFPATFVTKDERGRPALSLTYKAAEYAALSPFRVHLFLLGARLSGDPARLSSPPWSAGHPELVPTGAGPTGTSQSLSDYLRVPFAWPHFGMSMTKPRDERAAAYQPAWDGAIADQLLRAIDVGKPERAVLLGEKLFSITPSGYSAALYGEALRAAGRRETLAEHLASLPTEFRSSPSLAVVEALAARDEGNEARAREILGQVARVFQRPGVVKALAEPMARWPATLHAMTGENLGERKLELPSVGRS